MIASKNNDLIVDIPGMSRIYLNGIYNGFTPDSYDCRYIADVFNGKYIGNVHSTEYRELIYNLMLHS